MQFFRMSFLDVLVAIYRKQRYIEILEEVLSHIEDPKAFFFNRNPPFGLAAVDTLDPTIWAPLLRKR
jgi:hypothetical protein